VTVHSRIPFTIFQVAFQVSSPYPRKVTSLSAHVHRRRDDEDRCWSVRSV